MLGDLGVSTLRSIQDHDSGFFSFEHQTSHAACFNAQGLHYECLQRPLVFLVVPTCWKPVSHHVVTRTTFSSFFLDHHTSHLARHDARILLMSASSMPSEFFHRRFDLFEAYFQ
jgi:hypothetical protein